MSKAAPLAALFVAAWLVSTRPPASPSRPAPRARVSRRLVAVASARPPALEQSIASAPADAHEAPTATLHESLAALAAVSQASSTDDEALINELVSLSRRLLQGDLALAQATVAETDRDASPPHVRNLCILLLTFTSEPHARQALRDNALSMEDDRATLAIEAVTQFQGLQAHHSDYEIREYWCSSLLSDEEELHPVGWERRIRDYEIDRRPTISLAPPAEGEEGEPMEGECREVLFAVTQSGASLVAREKAIEALAVDPTCADRLRKLARNWGTPGCVKSAVYANIELREDDFKFIKSDVEGTRDTECLARLCGPLLESAGVRDGEAIALLEGLAPLADWSPTLAGPLMSALGREQSSASLMAIERICRSAGAGALRSEAVGALYSIPTIASWRDATLYRGRADAQWWEDRRAALQRLSSAPSAPLAAEASLAMLTWARSDVAVARASVDGAFLARAQALSLMPSVPERVRQELTQRLADWEKQGR